MAVTDQDMAALEQRYTELMREARRLAPNYNEVAACSGHFEPILEAEAIRLFLGGLRVGLPPRESACNSRDSLRCVVRRHNAQRPNDHNWLRHVDAGQDYLTNLAEVFCGA